MDDNLIIDLYWQRNEQAVAETEAKYGPYCRSIAYGILQNNQDTEECVNDTWLRAWDSIPPQRPGRLSAFLGRIARNLALDRYDYNHAAKRSGPFDQLLSELSECIPCSGMTSPSWSSPRFSTVFSTPCRKADGTCFSAGTGTANPWRSWGGGTA